MPTESNPEPRGMKAPGGVPCGTAIVPPEGDTRVIATALIKGGNGEVGGPVSSPSPHPWLHSSSARDTTETEAARPVAFLRILALQERTDRSVRLREES